MNAASYPRDPDLMGRPPRRWGRILVLSLLGGMFGMGSGYGIGHLVKRAGRAGLLTWSDETSMVLAAMLTVCGFLLLLASLSRTGTAYVADPHDEEGGRPVRPARLAYLRLQGLVLFLSGVMLFAPVLLPLLVIEAPPELSRATYWVILGLFAIQTMLNLALWRRSDELIRRTIVETGALSFWVLQGLIFLWAAGERLIHLPVLSSWDGVTVLMGFYLIASTIVAIRRGLN